MIATLECYDVEFDYINFPEFPFIQDYVGHIYGSAANIAVV